MSVHYKFKSSKNEYDTVIFDGPFISLGDLKINIVQQKKFGKTSNFDLQISNAQTSEVYSGEGTLIPKNTSVIVRRIPVTNVPSDVKNRNISSLPVTSLPPAAVIPEPKVSTWKRTENAGYPVQHVDEEKKIDALVNMSFQENIQPVDDGFPAPMPMDYVCYRCGVPGHRIQFCPTNGNPQYDMVARIKKPTGIPKSFLTKIQSDQGSQNGASILAVLTPNEDIFERETRSLKINKSESDIPVELLCPLCKNLLNEAVLISCCGKSFCKDCIEDTRDHLDSTYDKVRCPNCKNQAKLIPNHALREAVEKQKKSNPDKLDRSSSRHRGKQEKETGSDRKSNGRSRDSSNLSREKRPDSSRERKSRADSRERRSRRSPERRSSRERRSRDRSSRGNSRERRSDRSRDRRSNDRRSRDRSQRDRSHDRKDRRSSERRRSRDRGSERRRSRERNRSRDRGHGSDSKSTRGRYSFEEKPGGGSLSTSKGNKTLTGKNSDLKRTESDSRKRKRDSAPSGVSQEDTRDTKKQRVSNEDTNTERGSKSEKSSAGESSKMDESRQRRR